MSSICPAVECVHVTSRAAHPLTSVVAVENVTDVVGSDPVNGITGRDVGQEPHGKAAEKIQNREILSYL